MSCLILQPGIQKELGAFHAQKETAGCEGLQALSLASVVSGCC